MVNMLSEINPADENEIKDKLLLDILSQINILAVRGSPFNQFIINYPVHYIIF